jgi:hypothetical protein
MLFELRLGIFRFTILNVRLTLFEMDTDASSNTRPDQAVPARVAANKEGFRIEFPDWRSTPSGRSTEQTMTRAELPIVDKRMKYKPVRNFPPVESSISAAVKAYDATDEEVSITDYSPHAHDEEKK